MADIVKVRVDDITYGILASGGGSSGGFATVTLSKNNWEDNVEPGGAGTYTQTVTVEGINSTTSCVIGIDVDDVVIADIDNKYSLWSNIYNARSVSISGQESGGIKFYSKIRLDSDIKVNVKW